MSRRFKRIPEIPEKLNDEYKYFLYSFREKHPKDRRIRNRRNCNMFMWEHEAFRELRKGGLAGLRKALKTYRKDRELDWKDSMIYQYFKSWVATRRYEVKKQAG